MLVDTHTHIDDDAFAPDLNAVLARARAAGVMAQVVAGYVATHWSRLRQTCAAHEGLHAAYGLHPLYVAHHQPADLALLEHWIEQQQPVAIGECGLDFYVAGLDSARQAYFFSRQLAMAKEANLPVVIHARRAVDAVIAEIKKHPGVRGMVHGFVGSAQQAMRLVDLGFSLSFGGPLTYERAHRVRACAQAVPEFALLLETDAPDQPLAGWQGQRNEPARLPQVLAVLAQLRETDPMTLAATTTDNARQLFKLAV